LAIAAFACLLVPQNRVSFWAYPVLCGGPLGLALILPRDEADDSFKYWAGYIFAFVVFVVLRRFADDLGIPPLFGYVVAADTLLGLVDLPTAWLQQFRLPWFDLAGVMLHLSYYVAPPAVGIFLWLFSPDLFRRYILALIIMYAVGLALHILLPTAPPWLAAARGDIAPVRRIVHEILYHRSPGFYEYGISVAGANDVAAMPSLHSAASMVIALALYSWRRVIGVTVYVYAILMGLALVYLGEHYVIDVLAGYAVAVVCWKYATQRAATQRGLE
jgi:membrane-associated phospholipid phosphatase